MLSLIDSRESEIGAITSRQGARTMAISLPAEIANGSLGELHSRGALGDQLPARDKQINDADAVAAAVGDQAAIMSRARDARL